MHAIVFRIKSALLFDIANKTIPVTICIAYDSISFINVNTFIFSHTETHHSLT